MTPMRESLARAAPSVAAIALAGAVWWLTPTVLDWIELGEFAFVGRFCAIALALSLLARGIDGRSFA